MGGDWRRFINPELALLLQYPALLSLVPSPLHFRAPRYRFQVNIVHGISLNITAEYLSPVTMRPLCLLLLALAALLASLDPATAASLRPRRSAQEPPAEEAAERPVWCSFSLPWR